MTTNENGAFPTPEMFEIERLRKELAIAEGQIQQRSDLASQLQTLAAERAKERDRAIVEKTNLLQLFEAARAEYEERFAKQTLALEEKKRPTTT